MGRSVTYLPSLKTSFSESSSGGLLKPKVIVFYRLRRWLSFLRQDAEYVGLGDNPNHFPVFHDGQAANLAVKHHFCGFANVGIGGYGDGLTRHYLPDRQFRQQVMKLKDAQRSRIRRFGFANVAQCDDADEVPSVHHGQTPDMPVLQHLVTLIRGEAHEKGIDVETEVSSGLPLVFTDENQITQVFLNIMINALQAMGAGGKLSIHAEERTFNNDRWVNVSFSDTGPGMDRAKINKIFEPFFSTRQGGTGLGLAIAHRIIEDHGGSIHVESVEGSGSVFTVQLPVRNNIVKATGSAST